MNAFTITDVGKVRSENQDCVRFVQNHMPRFEIAALCDGMGGAKAGGVASGEALSAFIDKLTEFLLDKKSHKTLREKARLAAEYANEAVYESAFMNEAYYGMGTTLVAAVIKGKECAIVNVGDSRAYIIADGKIKQITNDHSFVADMVRRGSITQEQAMNHPKKNIITRALGIEPDVECDVFSPIFKKKQILLLCSDGLSNTLTDDEILEISQRYKTIEEVGKELLEMALLRGAPDNVTIGLLQK